MRKGGREAACLPFSSLQNEPSVSEGAQPSYIIYIAPRYVNDRFHVNN